MELMELWVLEWTILSPLATGMGMFLSVVQYQNSTEELGSVLARWNGVNWAA